VIDLIAQGMAVGVALAAPIGPINIEIVRRGILGGFWSGWSVGLGAVSADTIYCTLVVAGLVRVADSAAIRTPLFLAGAIVLCYLGVQGLKRAWDNRPPRSGETSGRRGFVVGFALAAASPMGIVYWLSIGAALVARAVEHSGQEGAPILVAGVFIGIVCWVTFLSVLTQGGRKFVSMDKLRWATAVASIMLFGFGVSFLVQGLRGLIL
jgi:threonine/homoserine/homoserine lactone efflux protein